MGSAERTEVQARLSRGAEGWEISFGATDTLIIPAPLAVTWACRILAGSPTTSATAAAALAVETSGEQQS